MPKTLFVTSPHSDDAALSLACTLWALTKNKINIVIIYCFSKSNWAPRLTETDVDKITRIRAAEDAAFAKLLGGTATSLHLNLDDASLRGDWKHDETGALCAPDPDVTAASHRKLELALQPFLANPEAAWALPLAIAHRDHRIVRNLLLKTARDHPKLVYEDVPYVFNSTPTQLAAAFRMLPPTEGWRRASSHDADAVSIWRQALTCYPSQFDEAEIAEMLVAREQRLESTWINRAFAAWLVDQ